jgi:DNA-binding NtrC family response regulator
VDEFSEAYKKPVDAIDQASMAALQAYSWPGNARELRNVVERAMIVPAGRRLRIPLLTNGSASKRRGETLAALEKEHITAILAACGGRIQGRGGAAARLGLSPKALSARMTRLGIHRPRA